MAIQTPAAVPKTDELAAALLSKRSDLDELQKQWMIVEDVLEGPAAMKTETYLPQHLNEHEKEYDKRKRLTPVFAETPGILQSRQGALCRTPPAITLPDSMKYLETQATLSGMTLLDVVAKSSELDQCNGFHGILLDRRPVPKELQGKEISMAEKKSRDLGRVYMAIYSAEQILNFSSNAEGLVYVKLHEVSLEAGTWNAKPVKVHTVRIVDRENISLFKITELEQPTQDGKYSIETFPPVKHGFTDAANAGIVPFRFFHPFPVKKDKIGRPILAGAAQADVAAMWVLSELLWQAYMLCPILTLKTDRTEDEIEELELGTSRFIPLKNKNALTGNEGEALEFVHTDAQPIQHLMTIHQMLVSKAKDAGGKNGAAALPVAVEQSGVSKAWTFKTTEERILFLLSICLQAGFQWLLEVIGRAEGQTDAKAISITFPDSFDIASPAEEFASLSEAVDFFLALGVNGAAIQLLLKGVQGLLPNLDEQSFDEIKKEIEALRDKDPRPEAALRNALKPPEPPPAPDQGRKKGPAEKPAERED
ncbi:MAG: hypothetical protein KIS92_00940 [Planctomycetota bacterium]|nr:hypothetical protein [Planctomycetota bacterium]